MDATELAYYGGLLDGEGHIGIRQARRARDGRLNYAARISLIMSHEPIIRRFADDFGLSMRSVSKSSPLTRVPMYGIEVAGRKTVEILEQVLPYLCVKRKQAELLVQLEKEKRQPGIRTRKIPTQRRMGDQVVNSISSATDPDILAGWQDLYMQVRELNRPSRQSLDS